MRWRMGHICLMMIVLPTWFLSGTIDWRVMSLYGSMALRDCSELEHSNGRRAGWCSVIERNDDAGMQTMTATLMSKPFHLYKKYSLVSAYDKNKIYFFISLMMSFTNTVIGNIHRKYTFYTAAVGKESKPCFHTMINLLLIERVFSCFASSWLKESKYHRSQ